MGFLDWNDSYSLGIAEIDMQHKKLVFLIVKLYEAMSQAKANDVVGTILNELVMYTKTHFSTEEKYFAKFAYVDKANHELEHKKFVAKINDFKEKFDSGKVGVSIQLMNFLKDWLVHHIMKTDRQYVACFQQNGLR